MTITGGNSANTITVGGTTPSTTVHTFTSSALSKINYTSAAGVQTITTGGAADTIKAGDGADVLVGGAGDDVFSYATSVEFITTGGSGAVVDTVTGGDGTDTISVTGAFAIASGDSMARVGTVEKLVAATQSASALTQSIVINGDTVLSSIRTIDLSADTNATSTGNIVLTGVTVDATLKGVAAGVNTLIGGAGSDVITGGSGVDKITGAAKADTIDAGAGDDLLYYLLTADLFTSQLAVDSIVGGDGTGDSLMVGTSGTAFAIAANDSWARVSGVETITAVANTEAVAIVLNANAATAGINKVDLSLVTKTTGNSINVSAFTSATTLIGATSTGNADIIGGGGIDTITAAAAGGSITGGAGVDIITGAAGVDTIVTGTTTASADAIKTFTSTTDKVKFGGSVLNVATATISNAGDVSASATLDAAIVVSATATQYVLSNAAFDIDSVLTTFLTTPNATNATAIVTAAMTALNATAKTTLDATFGAAETVLFVLDGTTGTSGAVFSFTNSTNTANVIDAGELVLVGVTDVVLVNVDIIL